MSGDTSTRCKDWALGLHERRPPRIGRFHPSTALRLCLREESGGTRAAWPIPHMFGCISSDCMLRLEDSLGALPGWRQVRVPHWCTKPFKQAAVSPGWYLPIVIVDTVCLRRDRCAEFLLPRPGSPLGLPALSNRENAACGAPSGTRTTCGASASNPPFAKV